MKVTYTEEALADIVEAITYLEERNPTAAANLDVEISRCIERLADREFDGPSSRLRSGAVVRSWGVRPFRVYYQRHPSELLILRVYHQARRPNTRSSIQGGQRCRLAHSAGARAAGEVQLAFWPLRDGRR